MQRQLLVFWHLILFRTFFIICRWIFPLLPFGVLETIYHYLFTFLLWGNLILILVLFILGGLIDYHLSYTSWPFLFLSSYTSLLQG